MYIVVVVTTSGTRWTAYCHSGVVEAQGTVVNYTTYATWLEALAVALRPRVANAADNAHEIMVVMPCSINESAGTLVGWNGNGRTWANRQPAYDLARTLNVPVLVHLTEGGLALLASENNTAAPARLAICWGAGVTAAVTQADSTIMPIAAGHLPIHTRNETPCACGKTGCVGRLVDGSQLVHDRLDDLVGLTSSEWSKVMLDFARYVVMPLAIAYPGAAIVIGGEVFNHANMAGMNPLSAIATNLQSILPDSVIMHLVSDPTVRDPLTDGGLLLLQQLNS